MNSVIDSEKPLISVVMPCYNEAERIGEAVASVFRQTFRSLELIVVDDGSSDNSLQVLYGLQAKHGRLQVFSQPNRGAGPARNMGLQHARGEYIAFLDADDAWHPACLEKLHARLAATPDAALVYCGWQNIGLPADQGRPFIPPEYEGPDKVETLLRGCRWPIHAALTRREAITRSGGFDEQWSSCMDYDLWLRIAAFERIVRLPEVLAYYHHHGGEQITKNRLRIATNHCRIQEQFLERHPEVAARLGPARVRDILESELRRRAFTSYWKRDLVTAHALFRRMLGKRRFRPRELRYLLPALLPLQLYVPLIRRFDQ